MRLGPGVAALAEAKAAFDQQVSLGKQVNKVQKQNELWDKAQTLKDKPEPDWTAPDCKTMIQHKKLVGDSAMNVTQRSP